MSGKDRSLALLDSSYKGQRDWLRQNKLIY
jgi:hypothetical protein